MKFRVVQVENFAPFGGAQLEFPKVRDKPLDVAEVHLFTGVNGTGKTRLLTVLAAILGNPKPLQARLGSNQSVLSIEARAVGAPPHTGHSGELACSLEIGQSTLTERGGVLYGLTRRIPAFAYKGTAYVTDVALQPLPGVPKPSREACLAFIRPETESKSLLEAIVNVYFKAAVESMDAAKSSRSAALLHDAPAPSSGPSLVDAAGAGRASRMVEAIELTISSITGRAFCLRVSAQPVVTVVAKWGEVEIPFALLPDGLRAIIGWMVHAVVMMDAWLEGNADPLESEAIFLLDEIESHLHPAWQRRILPAFQKLCPKSQIFVATHSPFVIASLNHGWIHPLTVEADGRVVAKEPVAASQGDSYVSVLEEIMGFAEWYDPETEDLLTRFRAQRDAAYRGDPGATDAARQLAAQIGKRSMELGYMMGRELSQMDRQLTGSVRSK